MENVLIKDARLRQVQWKDLVPLTRWQIISELLISLPWLTLSLLAAYYNFIIPALFCSFVFFLTGLRQVHNAYHYALGISPTATEWVMYTLSVVMMTSMHAVKYNHLQHHKHCLDEEDIEGMSARMSMWKAFLVGPVFPVLLHYNALKNGNSRLLRWILFEMASYLLFGYLVFFVLEIPLLKYHVTVMLIGECMTSFFAVWTVHHDCDSTYHIARTIRGRFKSAICYNMFYHVEHHLFPKVPTCNLPKLAERLDEKMPELKKLEVF